MKAVWAVLIGLALVGGVWAHGDKTHVLDTSEAGMKAIAEALGVDCVYCHTAKKPNGEPDYAAPALLKETAIYMHQHFVEGLVQKDGAAVTCATCHQGRVLFLPRDTSASKPSRLAGRSRSEIVALMKTMQEALGVQTCDYCHVRRRDGRLNSETPTPNRVTARYMMDHFTDALLDKNTGKPATCGTCHQGEAQFLPRSKE